MLKALVDDAHHVDSGVRYSGSEEHAWEVSNNEGLMWGSSGWKVFSM